MAGNNAKMEIDIAGVLERNREALMRQIESAAKIGFEEAIQEKGSEAIYEVVDAFIKKEIKPALRKNLMEMKAGILRAFLEELEKVAAMLASKMFDTVKENLSTSYKFEKIMKNLFDFY